MTHDNRERRDRGHRRKRPFARAGQSLVEFALFLPLFLTLLGGIVDTGMLLSTKNTVSYAARQGARLMEAYGAQQGYPDGTILQSIKDTLKAGGLNLNGLQKITFFKSNAGDTATANSGDSAVDAVYTYHASLDNFSGPTGAYYSCTTSTNAVTCPSGDKNMRLNGDFVGVTITYHYNGITPLYSGGVTFNEVSNTQIDPNNASYVLPTPLAQPTLIPPPPPATYTPAAPYATQVAYTPNPTYTMVAVAQTAIATYQCPNAVAGLVGCWPLDDGPGSSTVQDLSGQGNLGVLTGSYSWVAGHSASALQFDGSTGYVSAGTTNIPAINGAQTISWWMNFAAPPPDFETVIGLANSSGTSAVQVGFRSGMMDVRQSGGHVLVAAPIPSANAWHHYVYTYDAIPTGVTGVQGTHRLYIDGAPASGAGAIPTSTDAAQTGAVASLQFGRWVGGFEYYKGALDEVRIYNRALSLTEVQGLYHVPVATATTAPVPSATNTATPTNTPTYTAIPTSTPTSAGTATTTATPANTPTATTTPVVVPGWTASSMSGAPGSTTTMTYTWSSWGQGMYMEMYYDGAPICNPQYFTATYQDSCAFVPTGSAGTHYLKLETSRHDSDFEYIPVCVTSTSYTINVACPLPPPWSRSDIGAPGIAGGAGYIGSEGAFYVTGSGGDIWNNADSFDYVSQPYTGTSTLIVARVASMQNTDPYAKAGVMIRTSLDLSATNAMMELTPQNGAFLQYRSAAGGTTTCARYCGVGITAPYWVALTRSGDSITGYVSPDGQNFYQMYTVTFPSGTLGATLYYGLAVTSHNNSTANTARFDNVTVGTGSDFAAAQAASASAATATAVAVGATQTSVTGNQIATATSVTGATATAATNATSTAAAGATATAATNATSTAAAGATANAHATSTAVMATANANATGTATAGAVSAHATGTAAAATAAAHANATFAAAVATANAQETAAVATATANANATATANANATSTVAAMQTATVAATAMATCNNAATTGLVGCWHFDEGSGATTADSSGNGNDGTLYNYANGGASLTTGGHSAGALQLNAAQGGYVNAGANNMPANNAPQTISLWMNVPSIPGNGVNENAVVLTKNGAGNGTGVQIGFRGPNLDVWQLGANVLLSVTPPMTNTWTHYVYTFDGTTHRLYVNGALQVSAAISVTTVATPDQVIFGNYAGGSEYFNGALDEIRIYNRALNPTEVQALDNAPLATATPSPTNTAIPTATPTNTLTPTATPTSTSSSTPTATSTLIPTATSTRVPTMTPTNTPTSMPTATATNTATATPTSIATNTPVPTVTPTSTATATVTPTNTPVPLTATATPMPTPLSTPLSTPTMTPTSTPLSTPTMTPTSTPLSTPTMTPTSTPLSTPTP